MSTPAAYLGNDPYIFVSYAHRDKDKVFPFIEALQNKYNVWFDDGIHFGKEWEDEIGEKLRNCTVFFFVVTQNALTSDNCKDELNYARTKSKTFINVIAEQIQSYPDWFELRYMRYQNLILPDYSSLEKAVSNLALKCPDLEKARSAAPAPEKTPDAPKERRKHELADLLHSPIFEIVPENGEIVLKGVRNQTISEAVVPQGVTKIGNDAFMNCTHLTSVTIPQGVTSIGDYAFYNCTALTNLLLPPGVASIGRFAFYHCTGLTNVVVPPGMLSIAQAAFFLCDGLKSVVLPSGMISISDHAFSHCHHLKTVCFRGKKEQWKSVNIGRGNRKLTCFFAKAKIIYEYKD